MEKQVKTHRTTEVKTAVELTEDEVKAILRRYVDAPDGAAVEFDIHRDMGEIDGASVSWTVREYLVEEGDTT